MKNGPKKPSRDLGAFGASIRANAEAVDESAGLDDLRQRLDELELLVEEVSRFKALQEEVRDYVADLKREHEDLRNFRWWITTFSTVTAVCLGALLAFLVLTTPAWFISTPDALRIPLLLSIGGGSVILMIVLLKGVYRTRAERNADEMMPESLRTLIDVARG